MPTYLYVFNQGSCSSTDIHETPVNCVNSMEQKILHNVVKVTGYMVRGYVPPWGVFVLHVGVWQTPNVKYVICTLM